MTMLLLDAGNARLKWASLTETGLSPHGHAFWRHDWAGPLRETIARLGAPAVWIASVAGAERDLSLQRLVVSLTDHKPSFIAAVAAGYGVINGYHHPERLGVDRWAALVAARARTPDAVCVVDAGTAITVDAMNAQGEFVGGAILPGVHLQLSALDRGAAQLHGSGLRARGCLGRDTDEAIGAGVMIGIAGAVTRLLAEQADALGVSPRILLTGGDAPDLLRYLVQNTAAHDALPSHPEHVPDLLLEGIAVIAQAAT